MDLSQASIYVGTYKKYNEGSLFGKWMKLEDYSDHEDFIEACANLHADEEDPEFMFQDHEHIPESLISESWLSGNFFEVRDALGRVDRQRHEPFFIWLDNNHTNLNDEDIDELISSFDDEYQGEYSEEDFARHIIETRHSLDDFALRYFDYESYARDLFMGDYWHRDGHVFLNN